MPDPGNAERVRETQHVFQAVGSRPRRHAARQHKPPQRAPGAAIDRPGMTPPGDQREQRRPVAALGGHGEMVALRQPCREHEPLPDARTRRHRHDPVDVGIAGQNAGGPLEYEHVDDRVTERAPQAGDQRRREQYVS
jgi:hypothetical protein